MTRQISQCRCGGTPEIEGELLWDEPTFTVECKSCRDSVMRGRRDLTIQLWNEMQLTPKIKKCRYCGDHAYVETVSPRNNGFYRGVVTCANSDCSAAPASISPHTRGKLEAEIAAVSIWNSLYIS
jgi:hypothetical protein